MHTRPLLFALATCLLVACPSTELDEPDVVVEHDLQPAELGDLAGVSVCGDIWLAEAPRAEHLDLAARRGIRTVVSLLDEEAPGELEVAETCRHLGIAFVPVDAEPMPTDEDVDRAFRALDRENRGPTLMYCESGARAVMVFAVYRAIRHDVPVDEVLADARGAGMKPGASEEFVRAQIERLRG